MKDDDSGPRDNKQTAVILLAIILAVILFLLAGCFSLLLIVAVMYFVRENFKSEYRRKVREIFE